MPTTDSGKAIACRNATTHGLFARDIVLPSLGEDPAGYLQMETEWTTQLVPRNLLERHYVEKIAAASWRLRRLHRWQAQLFEDDTLTEAERLDRLNGVMRHETALHRQIDTAIKLLARDVPQLYERRVRDQVLEDSHISERECREDAQEEMGVDLETRNRLYQMRKATAAVTTALAQAPLDAVALPDAPAELPPEVPATLLPEAELIAAQPEESKICRNEPAAFYRHPRRLDEYLDPDVRMRFRARPYAARKTVRMK